MNKTLKTIQVKYFDEEMKRNYPITVMEHGDWIDLRAAKTVTLKQFESAMVPLGVGMILPKHYEAHIVPRSSTFKNYGIIQTNHMGVIDNSYSGDNDQWYMPVYATRDTVINKGDRICQFRIMKNQPPVEIVAILHLNEKDRGGFGSTGVK